MVEDAGKRLAFTAPTTQHAPWGMVDFTAICDCLSGAPIRPKYGDGDVGGLP